ncbi:MAG: metalloregulator ArsR/SmtB family transcription factor [bacterium]|nr:metalloregulator ArsR/SmtB family transcription factor [bacterium]
MAKNEFICDCRPINEELVSCVKEGMLSDEIYDSVAGFFKIVGDPTRCKIISVLAKNEMCVGDIANVLSMTKSSISHQLSKMKESGVVKNRKEGKEVYYSLDDEHVAEIFALTVAHMQHICGSR